MFNINIITIFPDFFINFLETGIVRQAQLKKKVAFSIYNLRDFTSDKHKTVDDTPYGGGAGMVLKAEPIYKAVDYIKKKKISDNKNTKVILFSPQGKVFSQKAANSRVKSNGHIIMICGRYEGVDERVKKIVDEELSIGDYVLSGGEVPAMVVSEALVRLVPGVLGKKESYKNDSFYNQYLDCPHYTKPEIFHKMRVPKVLLSGNHKKIETWRKQEAYNNTRKKRPDLLTK